jgi:hypothetical protein
MMTKYRHGIAQQINSTSNYVIRLLKLLMTTDAYRHVSSCHRNVQLGPRNGTCRMACCGKRSAEQVLHVVRRGGVVGRHHRLQQRQRRPPR